ncbi:MAG: hypothetical protein IJA00_04905 [Bacteroidaceae bacterium]|nr:hypothetical protein [Bacteroidaceae bacterium]
MRFIATFLIEQSVPRIWWQEVAEKSASVTYVSDGNIPNENKHPKRFISMIIAAKSYSSVKNRQKSNFSVPNIFPAHPIELT